MAKLYLKTFPLNDWERNFLTGLINGNEMMGGPPERLSTRQAETLFEIRDTYELHSRLNGGFSIPTLIQRIYEARLDLSENDEAWIVKLRDSGAVQPRRGQCGILRRLAIEIGAIEGYMDDAA